MRAPRASLLKVLRLKGTQEPGLKHSVYTLCQITSMAGASPRLRGTHLGGAAICIAVDRYIVWFDSLPNAGLLPKKISTEKKRVRGNSRSRPRRRVPPTSVQAYRCRSERLQLLPGV
jgi:hypothetical protein